MIFPKAKNEHKVQYFDKDEDAVRNIMDLVYAHNCQVFLLHGFTDRELAALNDIPNIITKQTKLCSESL